MTKAIYPGSFDPITNGHLDVIERASRIFDAVTVGVAQNEEKTALFSMEERLELIRTSTAHLPNVDAIDFTGLLVDFAKKNQFSAMIRGLRAISDFEFEFQMALMNRKLAPELETLFLMPREDYAYISSRIIKEIARLHGDVRSFVPPRVVDALQQRLHPQS